MHHLKALGPDLNAYTLSFEPSLLEGLRESYKQSIAPFFKRPKAQEILKGGRSYRQPLSPLRSPYYLFSYNKAPLLWVSSHQEKSFALFHSFFKSLALSPDIKKLVDCNAQIRMYCGFFVIGNQAPQELWHEDYVTGANAYTLITPLFEWNPDHGHLLYETGPDHIKKYQYTPAEALIFGEGFAHSTEPYFQSNTLRVLVSMTFGTDKIEHWPHLKKAITAQSKFYYLPCGHKVKRCMCHIKKNMFKLQKKL